MWHPQDECGAASNRAAYIEWLRATGARPLACPSDIARWEAADPTGFYAAATRFAGILPRADARTALLRRRGPRAALVMAGPPRRHWTRDELRANPPERVERLLRRLAPADLGQLAADHLFRFEIRPRDRVLWTGDPDDPWQLGVWIASATLLLSSDDPSGLETPSIITPDRLSSLGATVVLSARPIRDRFI